MTPGRHDDGTPSELRELAEEAEREIKHQFTPGTFDKYLPPREYRLARSLLSALDALESANERLQEGSNHALRLLDRAFAAEASRDQAIKERDRLAEATRDYALRKFVDTMHFHEVAMAEPFKAESELHKILRELIVLAGVPGGSPEEHNPGTTAAQSSVVGSDEA